MNTRKFFLPPPREHSTNAFCQSILFLMLMLLRSVTWDAQSVGSISSSPSETLNNVCSPNCWFTQFTAFKEFSTGLILVKIFDNSFYQLESYMPFNFSQNLSHTSGIFWKWSKSDSNWVEPSFCSGKVKHCFILSKSLRRTARSFHKRSPGH